MVPAAFTLDSLAGFFAAGGSPLEVAEAALARIAAWADPALFITAEFLPAFVAPALTARLDQLPLRRVLGAWPGSTSSASCAPTTSVTSVQVIDWGSRPTASGISSPVAPR